MLSRAGAQSTIANSKDQLSKAAKLILPGMGHFDHCMLELNRSGLRPIIEEKVLNERIPVLGICVGLQMLMEGSDEGREPGLKWIAGSTVRFAREQLPSTLKIPNMGWLEVVKKKNSDLLQDLENARFYFAHSYHILTDNISDTLMTAHYGYQFAAGVERKNIFGVQFHPEKSHRFGMKMLANFAHNVP